MKPLIVTCAIIEKDGRILCARRSETMSHPLKWEFPGGKVEAGETPEACLQREIKEELGVDIEILEQLPSNRHSYSAGKTIELIPFRCKLLNFDIKLMEHKQVEWCSPAEAKSYDWAAADIPILQQYILLHDRP